MTPTASSTARLLSSLAPSFDPACTPCPPLMPLMPPSNPAELLAAAHLGAAFGRTFSRARILTSLVLPLPASARLPTAEFDSIVVCNAGVYLFEVKGWDRCLVGRDKLEGGLSQWYLEQPGGQRRRVADPVAQGVEKMQALKACLDPRIAVKSFVIFPASAVRVCPTLPASVITLREVPYLPRLCHSVTKMSKHLQKIDDETVDIVAGFIEQLSRGLSLDEHIFNCQRFALQKKAARSAPGVRGAPQPDCALMSPLLSPLAARNCIEPNQSDHAAAL